ncbi:unnamed protein product [Microthlaspi erraticum]|uniref:NAD(+) ADP-ribosyltransferase n=1 Tax=Microthlaspi erraticum TaxID=1685480 RepID=A0A6D2HXN5_9BRAS|nr:unnamed protein product [Microthlaspi erraticum]
MCNLKLTFKQSETMTLPMLSSRIETLSIHHFLQGMTMRSSLNHSIDRFKEYIRDCPNHGFKEGNLWNIFYRGIDHKYKLSLDTASNGNFMTKTVDEAKTNVRDNNNKLFVLQVLESDNGKTYMVYFRWGRVGVKGQSKLDGHFDSCDRAIEIFGNKFLDKRKNFWADRKEFIPIPKLYTWLEMDYNNEENDSVIIAPFGDEVWKRISEVMDRYDRAKLEELSGEFYTAIPYDFGFKKMSQFVIDTPQSDWLSPCENRGIAAVHGYFIRWNSKSEWETCYSSTNREWKSMVEPVMRSYVEATDGTKSVLANEPVVVKRGQHIV